MKEDKILEGDKDGYGHNGGHGKRVLGVNDIRTDQYLEQIDRGVETMTEQEESTEVKVAGGWANTFE